jgi:transcriptional regulator with XRE-family HTH domain
MTVKLCIVQPPATPRRSHWDREAQRRFVLARHASGLTQEQAAQLLRRDRRTICRWETGERAVPAGELLKLEALAAEQARREAA